MADSMGFTRERWRAVRGGGLVWQRCIAAAVALAVALSGCGGISDVAAEGETADIQAVSVARAFEAAVRTHDSGELLTLLHPDSVVRERNAVLAAGRERLAAWVSGCLATDFALEPGTLVLSIDPLTLAPSATWEFADSTGCYWRLRPGAETAPWPGPEVNPAEGRLTITVAEGRVTSLTLVYSDAWQARYLRSVAAPIVVAQVRATATAAALAQKAAAATATAAEEARAAVDGAPRPPDSQTRTTPSVGPWLAALGLLGLVGTMAAMTPRSR